MRTRKYIVSTDVIESLNNGQDVHYEDVLIEGKLDFTASDEGNVRSRLTFVNCVFSDELTAYNEDQGDDSSAEFQQSVTLSNCRFEKSADFRHAQFLGTAKFDNATFADKVSFREAAFAGDANFRGAQFLSAVCGQRGF